VKRVLSLLLIFAAIGWSTALAQSVATATVEVKDESGAAVPRAEVTVVATPPSQTPRIVSRTDSSGTVSFELLPGKYDLSVKMQGFKDVSKQVVFAGTKHETFPVVVHVRVCSPCLEFTGKPASETYGPETTTLSLGDRIPPLPERPPAVAPASSIPLRNPLVRFFSGIGHKLGL
jgi:hypothetical protein